VLNSPKEYWRKNSKLGQNSNSEDCCYDSEKRAPFLFTLITKRQIRLGCALCSRGESSQYGSWVSETSLTKAEVMRPVHAAEDVVHLIT